MDWRLVASGPSFATNAGTEYTLSFELSGNPDGGNPLKTVQVDVAGVIQTFTFDTSAMGSSKSNMKWVLETLTFVATGGTTTLKFTSLDGSGPFGAVIAIVDVEVPEPGTLALLGAGLLATAGFTRRRRSGQQTASSKHAAPWVTRSMRARSA